MSDMAPAESMGDKPLDNLPTNLSWILWGLALHVAGCSSTVNSLDLNREYIRLMRRDVHQCCVDVRRTLGEAVLRSL